MPEDATSAALFRLDEREAPPTDASGNYGDGVPGGTLPEILIDPTATTTGIGRVFDGIRYFTATALDTDVDPCRTVDSIGVAVLLTLDVAGQAALGAAGCVAGYGFGEQVLWSVYVEIIDATARIARVWFAWWDVGLSAIVNFPGAEFEVPAGPFLLVASRERHRRGGSLRYSAGGVDLGRYDVPAADYVVSTTPPGDRLYVGSDGSLGVVATIEAVDVVARPVTAEEAEVTAARLGQLAGEAYTTLRGMLPPGVYTDNPTSGVQLEVQVQGGLFALAKAHARRLRRYWFPPGCWGDALEYWEAALRVRPLDDEPLAARQAHLADLFTHAYGPSAADAKRQLAHPLDIDADLYADAAITIEEFEASWSDAFDPPTVTAPHYYTAGHNPASWIPFPRTMTITLPTGVNDYLQISLGVGSQDLRYKGVYSTGGPATYLRYLGGQGARVVVEGQIRSHSSMPDEVVAGLVLASRVDDAWLWVGWGQVGGVTKIWILTYDASLNQPLATSYVQAGTAVGSLPMWIRVEHRRASDQRLDGAGDYSIRWAATQGGLDSATPYEFTGGPESPAWAGFGVGLRNGVTSVTGSWNVRFSDWTEFAPFGPQGLWWYALVILAAMPADAQPDLLAADLVAREFAQEHVGAGVVTHQLGLYVEDAATLLDRDAIRT